MCNSRQFFVPMYLAVLSIFVTARIVSRISCLAVCLLRWLAVTMIAAMTSASLCSVLVGSDFCSGFFHLSETSLDLVKALATVAVRPVSRAFLLSSCVVVVDRPSCMRS